MGSPSAVVAFGGERCRFSSSHLLGILLNFCWGKEVSLLHYLGNSWLMQCTGHVLRLDWVF